MPANPPDQPLRKPWWLWPNLLSLDAPLIALTWLVLFKSAYRVYALPTNVYWLLFGAVWVIYLVDRLLDSSETLHGEAPLEDRHRLHRHLRSPLWLLVTGGSVVGLWVGVTTLPAYLILCTIYLGILVVLYFLHRILMPHQVVPILPKELFCGILFAMGTALAPRVFGNRFEYPFDDAIYKVLQVVGVVDSSPYPLKEDANVVVGMIWFLYHALRVDVLPVALLFSMNCIAISCWEHRRNGDNDPSALATALPELRRWLGLLLLTLAACTGLAALFWGHTDTNPIYLSVVLGTLSLWLVNRLRHRVDRRGLRVLADVCLLTPWLVIPFIR